MLACLLALGRLIGNGKKKVVKAYPHGTICRIQFLLWRIETSADVRFLLVRWWRNLKSDVFCACLLDHMYSGEASPTFGHRIRIHRRATQQCNMSPYVYAVYWLPPASSAFLLARKCNWLAEKMLITCVMRHARLQKLQRLRREWPFYVFLFYDLVMQMQIFLCL